MRIAQLIDSLKMGGAEKLQVTLAAAARERNVELTVINLMLKSDKAVEEEVKALGARIIRVPTRRLLDWRAVQHLTTVLHREKFDVLQSHLEYANIIGALAGRLSGTPVIGTLHSAALHPKHHAMIHWLEASALRFGAKKVIAVGNMVAKAHQPRLGNQSIAVVPNAVAPISALDPSDRIVLRHKICGTSTRPLVISVGRLVEVKGYFDLLEAFGRVRQYCPDAALAIVGAGSLHDDLKRKINSLGLKDHAKLLGLRHDVPQLLAASDLYVSASHWEGLPLSILEAMSAGLPIVATTVGDIPKVVVEGTGLLVPPKSPTLLASAMHSFLHDQTKRRRFGETAKGHVMRHHSAKAWFDQLLAVYQEVISNHQPHLSSKVGAVTS